MADPIVVSLLIKKRAELAGQIEATRTNLNAMLAALDHLDGAIKVFAPEKSPELLPIKRKTKDQCFQRNELTRRIFDMLRKADQPMTSREIAERLAEAKSLPTDRRFMKLLVGRVINALKRQEHVLTCDISGSVRLWSLEESQP